MSLVTNERIKLTAALLNTVADSRWRRAASGRSLRSFGLNAASPLGAAALVAIVAIWLLVGVAFHLGARYLLGRSQS